MSRRNAAVLVAAIALANAALFAMYQRSDWTVQWTDQEGYRRLGAALAQTGTFTRYPGVEPFVPEVLRTPGYPAFVALVYRTLGTSQEAIAFAQALAFALTCLLVMRMTREISGGRAALVAGLLTALYAPLPYFGALVLSELWTACLLTLATWRSLVAARTRTMRNAAIAGAMLGLVALTRPAFVLLPFFVAAGLLLTRAWRPRLAFADVGALLFAFGIVLSPWLAYNYVYLNRVTISPAGGVGRTIWEGSWQGVWSGRTQAALTSIAESPGDDDVVEARVRELATATGDDPIRMREYIHQWRTVRSMWDSPTAPAARAAARIEADREYLRLGLENNSHDWTGWAGRRLGRGMILLWMGDIPIRYSDINRTPPLVVRAIWLAQGIAALCAIYGMFVLWRAGSHQSALLLLTPLAYITIVHLPLTTEPRLALPGKPVLLALAAIGLTRVTFPRTSGS